MPSIPPLDEMKALIKINRAKLGLSQKQLAKITKQLAKKEGDEVSQSFITKMENDKIEPSYRKIQNICKAMEEHSNKTTNDTEATVGDVCCKDVLFISQDTTIEEASSLMKEHDYSQLPIGNEMRVVGSITEKRLFEVRYKRKDIYPKTPISRVMEPAFPVLHMSMKIRSMNKLLLDVPAVLVRNKERIFGIITKIDMIV